LTLGHRRPLSNYQVFRHKCSSQTVMGCLRVRERGQVRREVRRWATTTAQLLELGEWLRQAGCTHVAMEATGVYWKPVWHILEGEFELILANPAHIRNVPGRKSDVNDATWIADLLAHGLIRASLVPPGPIQELRDLTRTRKQLMREIVQHKQRIQKVLEDATLIVVISFRLPLSVVILDA
jgi:transposase